VLLTRAFGVVVAVAIAMPFVQVTLALLALAPLIGALETPGVALLAVGIPLAFSAVAGIFLYRAARSLRRDLKQLSRGEVER
jgi:predicted benzoate:H+ symporter BenE